MQILHITNWYYSKEDPFKVPFVKEHFEALNLYSDGELVHVAVEHSENHRLHFKKDGLSKNERSHVIYSRIKKWAVLEIISTALTIYTLLKRKFWKYDVLIFHVGYPNLTYYHFWKYFIKKPILIVEHWTAFHYHFNLPKNTSKLDRIKKIYRQEIPVLTVSNQLNNDVQEFCGNELQPRILPNVVDNSIFYYDQSVERESHTFFMLNYWREIKSPFPALNAFKNYLLKYPNANLRIGGYGPLWGDIEGFVEHHALHENVKLLGKLKKKEVANEMRKASFFVHNADYETFSVVCAEAIACGCPVVVANLEAVKEFINKSNGCIVESVERWSSTLVASANLTFDHENMANKAALKFDKKVVGRIFFNHIKDAVDG